MKKPTITTAAAILFAVATAGVGVVGAQSLRGPQTPADDSTRPRMEMHLNHDAMMNAVEAHDYTSFVEAVGADSPILEHITADTFDEFVRMHELMKNGDTAGAKAITESLGLPTMPGNRGQDMHGKGEGMGMGEHLTKEQHDAVEAALAAGDYQAFLDAHGADSKIAEFMTEEMFNDMVAKHAEMEQKKAAVDAAIDARDYDAFVAAHDADDPILSQINETNFDQFAELHDLREAGDHDAAQALAEELGLERPAGRKGPVGMMHRGFGPRGGAFGPEQPADGATQQ